MHISYMTPINGLYSGKFRSLKVSETLLVTGAKAQTSGEGIVLQYDKTGHSGQLISMDFTANVLKGLQFAGSVITFYTGPAASVLTNLQLTNSGGSDVNFVSISSNTTGNGPVLQASGNDADVGLNLRGQGTGAVLVQKPFFTSVGARVAGDKYLIMDATGNVHVSAVGPAS